ALARRAVLARYGHEAAKGVEQPVGVDGRQDAALVLGHAKSIAHAAGQGRLLIPFRLARRARQHTGPDMTVQDLPTLNASLNSVATVFLIAGWIMIRRGRWKVHRACMLAAFAASTAFLTSYLVYHFNVGSEIGRAHV